MSNQVAPESSDFAVFEDDLDDGIEWSDPPSTRGRRGANEDAFNAIAVALRNRPGKWAKIAEATKNTSLVSQIKQGKIKAFEPEGAFDATGRRSEDGELSVWAKFIGDTE